MGFDNEQCNCGHGTINSHRLNAYGALQCDHCDSSDCVMFEDDNGEPVPQYVQPNGMLADQPYAQRGRKPTIGEIVAFGVMVTGLAMFWIGVGR